MSDEDKAKNAVMRVASAMLQRVQLAARAGLTHKGARDLYSVFGYKTKLTAEDYMAKYRRQDIAKRVVDAYPKAIWSDPPIITGSEGFNTAWKDFQAKYAPFPTLDRLDRLLGLGEYAVLVIGLNDGNPLDQPATKKEGLEVIYLQPYAQTSMAIKEYEKNTRDPRYGLPTVYSLKEAKIVGNEGSRTVLSREPVDIHWTRTLHVVEDPLENPTFGIPRLELVYNLLDDILKIAGGTAETYWLTANRGLHIDVDPEMSFTKSDADALSDEVKEYVHQLSRFIRTRGAKVNTLGSDTPDPRGVFDVLIKLISGATGIPARILLGSEAGQLASQQDRANWANRVEERRVNFAQPYILNPFFNRLIDLGVLPPGPQNFAWPDAFKMNPFERGQTAAQTARSAANLAKAMETNPQLMSVEEARRVISFGDLEPIFDEPGDAAKSEL